jgi:ribulose-bisphosphate carboxylase large chain
VGKLVKIAGRDIQIQAGGGVAGHPMGVRGGARAMAQAVDAASSEIPVQEYAKDHLELRQALEKWG